MGLLSAGRTDLSEAMNKGSRVTGLRLTLLVLQGVHGFLVLILEHLDKTVWHDFATPIIAHLSHDNVI